MHGQVNDAKLISSAIKGMVRARQAFKLHRCGSCNIRQPCRELGGIGIEITKEGELIKVVSAIDDGPASKADILPSDVITHVDGDTVQGLTLEQVVNKLKGPVNTTAKLTIARRGKEAPFEIAVTREIIQVRAVRSRV